MRSVSLAWNSFKLTPTTQTKLQCTVGKNLCPQQQGRQPQQTGTSLNRQVLASTDRRQPQQTHVYHYIHCTKWISSPRFHNPTLVLLASIQNQEATKNVYNFRGNLIRGKKNPQFLIHQSQFNVVPFPEEFGMRLNARNVYLQRLDAIYCKQQKTLINTDVFC